MISVLSVHYRATTAQRTRANFVPSNVENDKEDCSDIVYIVLFARSHCVVHFL